MMARKLIWVLMLACPLSAHLLSMSTGELRIEGRRGKYEIRMPLHEVRHIRAPESAILRSVHLIARGAEARTVSGACQEDRAAGAYVCAAIYEFREPPSSLDVVCTLHSITVANHVHVLRADDGKRTAQAVFDYSAPRAALRFDQPPAGERALRQAGEGAARALGNVALLLLLAGLALMAADLRELGRLTLALVAGEIAACLLLSFGGWLPPALLVESACALTVAYAGFEALFLPRAGGRWLIVTLLGSVHGLYFYLFLRTGAAGPALFFIGAVAAQAASVLVLAIPIRFAKTRAASLRPVPVCAAALFLTGLSWFFIRLRG